MGSINNTDWLQQLAPDHAPAAISWWPLAMGWWGLIFIFIMVVIGLGFWFFQPMRRLNRLALRELKRIEQSTCDDAALARDLEHLLRRYALTRFGRDPVARLTGADWIAFVVAHGGSTWQGDNGLNLLRAAYGGQVTDVDRVSWIAGARTFVQGKK
jgi:hypothetical protein